MHPTSLFKYLPPQRIDVLTSTALSFSRPDWFNDPFELNPLEPANLVFDEYARQSIRRIDQRTGGDFERTWKAYLQQQHRTIVDESVGILCLSDTRESLLMWAHYAASHSGFTIEFKLDDEFDRLIGPALQVQYRKNRRPLNVNNDYDYLTTFLTKSLDWAYESEYRIIRDSDSLESYQPTPGINLQVARFSPKSVACITLGCRATEETKGRCLDIASSELYSHVTVQVARLHESEFSLRFENLSRS